MERFIETSFDLNLTSDEFIARLHISEDDKDDFLDVFNDIKNALKPVLYYGKAYVESNDGRNVVIDGTLFTGRVLSVNLSGVETVYPYIMTSGREAYTLSKSYNDDLFNYWANSICETALKRAQAQGLKRLTELVGDKQLYSINPGSLSDWPVSQQKPLFELLGNVYESCGVELTDSFLMIPIKTVSGIWFQSETHYENCMLCPREGCMGRRAKFDAELFKKTFGE